MNTWVLRLDHARWFRDELARVEDRMCAEYLKIILRGETFRALEGRILSDMRDIDADGRFYVHVLNRADAEANDIDFVILRVAPDNTATTIVSSLLAEIALQEKAARAA